MGRFRCVSDLPAPLDVLVLSCNLVTSVIACRWWNQTCGIPLYDMVGFRAQSYVNNLPVRQVGAARFSCMWCWPGVSSGSAVDKRQVAGSRVASTHGSCLKRTRCLCARLQPPVLDVAVVHTKIQLSPKLMFSVRR